MFPTDEAFRKQIWAQIAELRKLEYRERVRAIGTIITRAADDSGAERSLGLLLAFAALVDLLGTKVVEQIVASYRSQNP